MFDLQLPDPAGKGKWWWCSPTQLPLQTEYLRSLWGLFVVCSLKGVGATAIAISNLLRERRATVVKKTFKAKIRYEAYPESQEEVDGMVARLHLRKVIYDP